MAIADRYADTDPGVSALASMLADDLDDRAPCWTCGSLDFEARERLTDCSSICPQAVRRG